MKTTTRTLHFADMPKTYAELVALHVPRPIHDRVSYENAVLIVHALVGFKLNRDQDDYLELMAKIIEDYERETMPQTTQLSGIEALRFLIAEHGMTGDSLGQILGVDRSIAYRILKGTRNLTVDHVAKLAEKFAVSGALFLPRQVPC